MQKKKKVSGICKRRDKRCKEIELTQTSFTHVVMSWMDLETQFWWELKQITCDHWDPLICTIVMSEGFIPQVRITNASLTYDFILHKIMALLAKNFRNICICLLFQLKLRVKLPFIPRKKQKQTTTECLRHSHHNVFCIKILLSKYIYRNVGCSMYSNSTSSVIVSQNK